MRMAAIVDSAAACLLGLHRRQIASLVDQPLHALARILGVDAFREAGEVTLVGGDGVLVLDARPHLVLGHRGEQLVHLVCARRIRMLLEKFAIAGRGVFGERGVEIGLGQAVSACGRRDRFLRLGRRIAGHEIDRRRAERAVDERLLPPLGRLQHFVAHRAEQEIDLEAGCLDVFEQRLGERAVLRVAVVGGRALLGGVGDERLPRRLDAREAAADRALRRARLHLRRERIVAAGVEHDEAEQRRALDGAHDARERHRLVLDVRCRASAPHRPG